MKKLLFGTLMIMSINVFSSVNCGLSIYDVNQALKQTLDTELSWSAKWTLKQKYDLNNEDTYPRLEISNYCHQEDHCWTIAQVISENEEGRLYIEESVSAGGSRVIESAIENGIEAAVEKLIGCK